MPHIVSSSTHQGADSEVSAGGVGTRWLVSSTHGGARHGMIADVRLGPGAGQPLHRHANAEEAAIVLDGDATVLTATGDQPAPAGTLILSVRGVWHGIVAGARPVRLLTVYGGECDVDALDMEMAQGSVEGAASETVGIESVARARNHAPEMGFYNMAAGWLVSENGLPSSELLIGRSVYGEPELEGGHVLHRHLVGEEFLYLLEGSAAHLTEDGERIPMAVGDIAFMPAPELHGIWNTGATAAHSIFGYLGANSLAGAGYELAPASAPSP